jgi:hypothetical protein
LYPPARTFAAVDLVDLAIEVVEQLHPLFLGEREGRIPEVSPNGFRIVWMTPIRSEVAHSEPQNRARISRCQRAERLASQETRMNQPAHEPQLPQIGEADLGVGEPIA